MCKGCPHQPVCTHSAVLDQAFRNIWEIRFGSAVDGKWDEIGKMIMDVCRFNVK